MVLKIPDKKYSSGYFKLLFVSLLFLSGCTVVRKYQKNKPFVYNNIINLSVNDVTPDEKVIIRSRSFYWPSIRMAALKLSNKENKEFNAKLIRKCIDKQTCRSGFFFLLQYYKL